MTDRAGSEGESRRTFDARNTKTTIEDAIEEIEEWDDDPERHFYMTTYSDVVHTTPRCPHLQNAERIHYSSMRSNLNGPYCAGHTRGVGPTEEHDFGGVSTCSWCKNNDQ